MKSLGRKRVRGAPAHAPALPGSLFKALGESDSGQVFSLDGAPVLDNSPVMGLVR